MNWTYTVSIWAHFGVKKEVSAWAGGGTYDDYKMVEYWVGEWFLVALYKLWRAKRAGYNLVQLEWR